MTRLNDGDSAAIAEANRFAELDMPSASYGDALSGADIQLGTWDPTTRVFTPGASPRSAVRVVTRSAVRRPGRMMRARQR